jgi:flagellar biosynthesis protein FlhG
MTPNNLIAIGSGKGGVGKTWFSITLAHLLARAGRRTLLFDGDVGLANVDLQLGLAPQHDLSAAASGHMSLRDTVVSYAAHFDIIAGRSGAEGLHSIKEGRLEKLCAELLALSQSYDFVILDLAAGIEDYVRTLTALASRSIVLVTDEPTSLTDAYTFIKLAIQRPPAPLMQVVVNQAATQKEGERTFAAIEKACRSFLHFSPELLGIIRKDNKVKDSIRSQQPLLMTAPHTTAATDLAAISIKLMQKDLRPTSSKAAV